MQKQLLILAFTSIVFSSCCDDTGDILIRALLNNENWSSTCDTTQSTEYLSSFNLSNGAYLPAVYAKKESTVLFTTNDGLAWYDVKTQSRLASINSAVAKKAFSYSDHIHQDGNLAVSASATGIAVVDMEKHQLVWERALQDCTLTGRNFAGVNNQYFATGKVMEADGRFYEGIYGGTLESPDDFRLLYSPAYSRQVTTNWAGYGRINDLKAFNGNNGQSYLLVSYFEPADANKILNFIGLYNLTAGEWVYDHEPLSQVAGHTGTLGIAITAGITAKIALNDVVIEWDIMAGKPQISISLPENVFANGVWSNDHFTLISTSESELMAFDNASNALLYRVRISGSYYMSVDFDQDLIFCPRYDGCQVLEASSGHTVMSIVRPCENDAPARFADATITWKDVNGALQLDIPSEIAVYRYALDR